MSNPLLPPERMALTVARAQIKRGEDPTPNVAAVLIMALARLVDRIADEPLYRRASCDCNAVRKGHRASPDCWKYIQVWPKEDTDE